MHQKELCLKSLGIGTLAITTSHELICLEVKSLTIGKRSRMRGK